MGKITEKIKELFGYFKGGADRFRVTVVFTLMVFGLVVLATELENLNYEKLSVVSSSLMEINKCFVLGIFLTAMFEVIREQYFEERKKWIIRTIYTVLTVIIGFGAYVLCFIVYNFEIGFWMLLPISSLIFLIVPILKNENKEKYLQSVFVNFVVSSIFATVLYIGISLILATITALFGFEMFYGFVLRFYMYSWVFIFDVLGISLFLSLLKKPSDNLENYDFPYILKMLIKFVITPLIIIYTGILYVYLATVVISMKLPKGLISHLVLWYTAFSLIIIILITPLAKNDKFLGNFKKYFPYFSIPLIFASLFAIFQRIYQYGITENRYYVLLLIFWLFFCMILYIIKSKVTGVFISLIICLIIAVYTPFSAEKVSVYSQSQRLKRMLVKYGALKDGKVSKITQNLTNRQGNELYTAIDYISARQGSSVKNLGLKNSAGKIYQTSHDLEKDLGIKDSWREYYSYGIEDDDDRESYNERKVITYNLKTNENTSAILETNGYDNVIHYRKDWGEASTQTNESDKYKVVILNKMITISAKNGTELAKFNYENIIKQVSAKLKTLKLQNLGSQEEEYKVPQKDFEYIGTAGNINYKISLQNIYEEIKDGKMTDMNYEFDFMFSEKK